MRNGVLDTPVTDSERGYKLREDSEQYRISQLSLEQMLHEVHSLGLKGDVDSQKVARHRSEIELRAQVEILKAISRERRERTTEETP